MLRVCLDCLTRFAADLERCPHCLSERFGVSHEVDAAAEAPPADAKAGKPASGSALPAIPPPPADPDAAAAEAGDSK